MWEGAQNSWPELAKGIFCTTEYHAQYINLGRHLEGGQLQFGNRFGIAQQVLNNCIIHHLFFLGFNLLCLLFKNYYYDFKNNFIFYFISIIKLILFQPTSFIFFSWFLESGLMPDHPSIWCFCLISINKRLQGMPLFSLSEFTARQYPFCLAGSRLLLGSAKVHTQTLTCRQRYTQLSDAS